MAVVSPRSRSPVGTKSPELLSKEQQGTVRAAEQQLTAAERRQISNRFEAIRVKEKRARKSHSCSPQANTSYVMKGKFVDNNLEVSDTELNIEAQRKALEAWKIAKKATEALSKDKPKVKN